MLQDFVAMRQRRPIVRNLRPIRSRECVILTWPSKDPASNEPERQQCMRICMSQSFRLMEYNPAWPQEYEQTRSSVLQATEGWVVDTVHIGGTGIVGATARPVIDVMIGIRDLQGLNEAATLVEGLNYRRAATPEWCDGELCAFLVKPRNATATHTVLAVRHEGMIWNQTKCLQSQLVDVQVLARELQQAKLDHYKADCNAESRYEAAKAAYYEELVSRLELN